MFEVFLTICLGGDPDICRDALVAGAVHDTRAACEAALAQAPEGAFCDRAGTALAFEEIGPGVFVHVGAVAEPDSDNAGDVANIGFVVGESSVAVIDAGSAAWIGEGVWRAIRRVTDLPVSHLILTHMHPDHALGAPVFKAAGARIVGHAKLDRALADRAQNYTESLARLIGQTAFLGSGAVATDIAVDDSLAIDLGGRSLSVTAWPGAHTATDLTVLDRASGLLFAGDLVFDDHAPALDGTLRGWQAVLGDLAAMKVTGVVPGHGRARLDWPEGATPMQRYLDVLARETRAAIDAGLRLGEAAETVAQSEAANWSLFEAYNPRNATVAFTELEWE